MRTDDTGTACPETLGEYRDLCEALGGEDCAAVKLVDQWISRVPKGRDAVVLTPDSQLRAVLMPLIVSWGEPRGIPRIITELPLPRGNPDKLSMWTVFASPDDFPGKFVARRSEYGALMNDIIVHDSLEYIRQMLADSELIPLPRADDDPEHVVETWT